MPRNLWTGFGRYLPGWVGAGARWAQATLVPSLSVATVNLSAVMILLAGVWFIVELFEPNPVREVRITRIEPASRIVDRGEYQALSVWRWVDMRKAAEVRVIRSWVDESLAVVPVLDDWIRLEAGPQERPPVRIYPPPMLAQGMARYRVALEYCSVLRCMRYHLPDIEILVTGKSPRMALPPEGPRF